MGTLNNPTLSVIVPAFNEAGNLRACVEELRAKLSAIAITFEILPVDDGSADATWAVCQELAQQYVDVKPQRHACNLGMGAAVRTGLGQARGDWVIVIPGDNQFDVNFGQMLAAGGDADIVVGQRQGGYTTIGRRLPSYLYSAGMRLLFGLNARGEVNLYRRATLLGVDVHSRGFFGNTELLIRVVRKGARVAACPIQIRDRVAGRSTGRDPRRIAQVLRETATLRARLWWEQVMGKQNG